MDGILGWLRSIGSAVLKKVSRPYHRSTADGMLVQADLLYNQGDFQTAGPLYRRALAIYESAFGSEDPGTTKCLNQLAALAYIQGDLESSERLIRRTLGIDEKRHGAEDPETATGLYNLARILQAKGDPAAEGLYRRSLAVRAKVLGPDHPNTELVREALSELQLAERERSPGPHPAPREGIERQATAATTSTYIEIAEQDAVSTARALAGAGYQTDYSLDSLREIDRFLEEQAPQGVAKPGGMLSEHHDERVFALGAYVGEVIRREFDGRWHCPVESAEGAITIEVRLPDGRVVQPVEWVVRRWKQGPSTLLYGLGLSLLECHVLAPYDGVSWLAPKEVVRRLGQAFSRVEVDEHFGSRESAAVVSQSKAHGFPAEMIAELEGQYAQMIYVRVRANDDPEVGVEFAVPQDDIIKIYHKSGSTRLVTTCQQVLGYKLERLDGNQIRRQVGLAMQADVSIEQAKEGTAATGAKERHERKWWQLWKA
jgi:tetratricopeptide (TPR) repeat protein